VAFVWLWYWVNLLTAALGVAACLFYVFVYTLWLKRTSKSNIVIGGAPERPVLTLVIGDQQPGLGPRVHSADVLLTPLHFCPGHQYKDDYASADVPMLPSVVTSDHGKRILPAPVWGSRSCSPGRRDGRLYLVAAVVLGGSSPGSRSLFRDPSTAGHEVFTHSITYITLLSGMALDVLVRT
jgi:protoheme IX farnesyltransferase